jgi:hypothetical protein
VERGCFTNLLELPMGIYMEYHHNVRTSLYLSRYMSMRMIWIVVLFILALLAPQHVFGAQQQVAEKSQPTFKEAVDICALIVRKETDNIFGVKYSQFDVYIMPDNYIEFIGTSKERFNFKKCLNEKGHPIELIRDLVKD